MQSANLFCLCILMTFVQTQVCLAQPTQATYANLSDAAAKAKFESTLVTLRAQQRKALQVTREELDTLSADSQLDKTTRRSLEQVSARLASTSDFAMALEFVLQSRSQFHGTVREAYDALATRLSEQSVAYKQAKLDYQPAAGRGLASRWSQLSLEGKRCELADYHALADERPAWLMRNSPINIFELVPKSNTLPINQYVAEKRELIRTAQTELQPALDRTIRLARQAASKADLSFERRAAAALIQEVLEAPYAGDLRGPALCQPSDQLPADVNAAVQAMLQQHFKIVEKMTPAHERLLRELHSQLDSGRSDRLQLGRFDEQMAIDIYLASITHLIQPTRVLANRSPRGNSFEDALLIELGQSKNLFRYRVEFLIDGVTQWVDANQIMVKQAENFRERMLSRIPEDGPGQVVTDLTDFGSGQVFAHCPAGWKPVIVVDESPLGVVIRWHGPAEPIEYYFPRRHLRIVPTFARADN